MKKINLIEWLSRNSHEKQKPQRFGRYAAMLMMLLTLGVGQVWASTTFADGDVLFYDFSDVTGGGGVNWQVNGNTMVGTGNVSVGTITGITMNNASKGTSGVVDLGTVITSETQLSKGTTTGK